MLAAGAGSRFGGGKLLAPIGGRPILQHVLDALAAAGIDDVVVVLGVDAAAIEAAIEWRAERRVVNPDPARGLSSSLPLGFETIGPGAGAVLVALGDQPLVSVEVIQALLDAPASTGRPIVVPDLSRRARPQPGPCPPARLRPRPRGDRRPRPRAAPRGTSGARLRDRSRRRQSRRGHAGRSRPCHRGGLGGTRPCQPRAGRADPRGPRRHRLLRPGQLALPRRPDADRRRGPRRAPATDAIRGYVARHRGGCRPVRAADRPGARPVGRLGDRARRLTVDARVAGRDRRGLRHRERPGRRGALAAGGRSERRTPSRRTSRSSPTSATTSRRSARSSTRWRRRPHAPASPS